MQASGLTETLFMRPLLFIAKITLVIAATTGSAHAYLEPGTVSMILQGLVAGVMVIATTIGVYWQKFLSLVYRITGKKPDDAEPGDADADAKDDDDDKEPR